MSISIVVSWNPSKSSASTVLPKPSFVLFKAVAIGKSSIFSLAPLLADGALGAEPADTAALFPDAGRPIAISSAAELSLAAACDPNTKIVSEPPNGCGHPLKSAARAPVKVIPNIAMLVPIAATFLKFFLISCI